MKKKNLFRKIYRLGAWCALSGMSVLAACTDEAATGLPAEGAAIRFDVGLSETWESGGSAPAAAPAAERPDTLAARGAEMLTRSRGAISNISVTVIDGLPPRISTACPQTRGAQKVGDEDVGMGTMISFAEAFGTDGFGVLGYACDEGESNWWTYITNTQITNEDGDNYWEAADGQACNWPGTWRNLQMRLFAYAPYDEYADEADAPTLEQNTGENLTIKIPYTTPELADDQKEFLVAATEAYESENYPEEVPLTFTHTLTAVRFVLTFTEARTDVDVSSVKVSKIEFNDVYTTGTYSVTYDEMGNMIAGEWNEADMKTGTLTLESISNGSLSESTGTGSHKEWYWPENQSWQENAPNDFFLMIPQIPPDEATVTVYFGEDTFIAFDLPDGITAAWQPNTTVIYHLSVSLDTLDGELQSHG